MNWRTQDGNTTRSHLEASASGIAPDKDAVKMLASEPPLPFVLADIWQKFLDLHVRRGRDENGPLRFSWLELQAYSDLTGARFDPFTRKVLFAVEDAYFAVVAEHKNK